MSVSTDCGTGSMDNVFSQIIQKARGFDAMFMEYYGFLFF